jgi:flotillin
MPDNVIFILVCVAVIILILAAFAVIFKMFWKVAEPNEALIISGRKGDVPEGADETMNFRIVTGKGTFVIPLLETCRPLSLNAETVSPHVECPTSQGVAVAVKGVVIFKVGDDRASIANAARRFLGMSREEIKSQVSEVFSGHLRSIVGGMTVEEMIQNRESLAEQARAACATEVQKLGLVIDSLQIQEIGDPSGYIANIAAPNLAQVRSRARIAEAEADQLATKAEQEAAIKKAEVTRDTDLKVAAFSSEVDARKAEAEQQGPLAQAKAKEQVVQQEAILAERRAELRRSELNSTVRVEADAEAYRLKTIAEAQGQAAVLTANANADAVRINGVASAEAKLAAGNADAEIIRAKGVAEGDALKAKAEAMKEGQDAVLAQLQVEQLPEVVKAAAAMYSNVGNLTVLNGAEGMNQGLMGLATLGGQILSQFNLVKSEASVTE